MAGRVLNFLNVEHVYSSFYDVITNYITSTFLKFWFKMDIVTLTLNPAIDKSSTVTHIVPGKKLRCERPVYEPGGGGINVSKALHILGASSLTVFMAGGPTGVLLEHLVRQASLNYQFIETEDWTRENLLIIDHSSGQEYKFIMPGPQILLNEWRTCSDAVHSIRPKPKYLVASGSLPVGIPENAYADLAKWAHDQDIRLILDTSGPALTEALKEGVFLIKPNLGEMALLAGLESISASEEEKVANDLISEKSCEIVVVSLGARGAMMASKKGIDYVVPPTVHQRSTVGAGDSMVAGLVLALSQNWGYSAVLKLGVAAGTAATMTSGSELCRKKDVDWIFKWLS